MGEGESLPIMKLTRSAKRDIAVVSVVVGVATTFLTYKATTLSMEKVLDSVGVLLYRDLGIVLKKTR